MTPTAPSRAAAPEAPARRLPAILSALLLVLPAVLVAVPATTPPAAADPPAGGIHLTLLGDSYSSGTGAGSYYGEEEAYRSRNSWAHRYVTWLNSQGAHATLTNLARNGHTTADLLAADGPVATMPTSTDVAMLTIGGNDVGFAGIVQSCFMLGLRDPDRCREKVDAAQAGIKAVRSQTVKILEAIDARLPDGAQVVLVGYPRLATDRSYVLRSLDGSSYDVGSGVRGLSDTARDVQSALVSEWNSSHPGLTATHIDGVVNAFDGHEPDPSVLSRNSYRWVNEFLETEGRLAEDGTTTSTFSLDPAGFYHPNIIGHEQVAALIQDKVGVPAPVAAAGNRTDDIDIAFVVDSTGSMSDDAEVLHESIRSVMETARASTASYRFALVDYKDGPQCDDSTGNTAGNTADYTARTDVDFTSRAADIEAGLEAVQLEGGGSEPDAPASVYSGVMEAAGLQWRDGARRAVVVLGGSRPHPVEPGTGYTAQSVAESVYESAASVYGINTEGSLTSQEFQELVTESGGTTAEAGSSTAARAVGQVVGTELGRPYAALPESYVVQVGDTVEIDAAASYASKGSITGYEWDLDGDGTFEEASDTARVQHAFTELYSGVVGVRVTQEDGQTAVATTRVEVTDDGDITPAESDNCPDAYNYGQSDYDGDGVGDECDPDPGYPTQDMPGVCVEGETCPSPTPTPSTRPEPSPSPEPSEG